MNKARELIKDASVTILGTADVMYELQEAVEKGKKFKYIVNGFSGNWTNIQVQWQLEGDKWVHKTIKK